MMAEDDHATLKGGERLETDTDVHGVPAIVVDTQTGPLSGIQLLCVAGEELGESFSITDTPVIVGRGHGDVSLRGGDVSRKHARISRRDGRFWIEDLRSANGSYVNGTAIGCVTELRFGDRVQIGSTILVFARNDELEVRLRQLQRLDAMGSLVKGLAHDFNNTLQVLLNAIEQLQGLAPTAETQSVLDEMAQASNSATGLVRRLLRIGRNKPETQDLVDLGDVVRTSVAMARRIMPANIQIEFGEAPDILVRGSRSELEQALLNVLANARDAMPNGGRIFGALRNVELDRAAAHARHLSGEGRFVELTVRDQGIGMNEETIARAFEPFFTTKAGRGTGLGLAMMYSTVKNHHGTALLESTPGTGTLVRIFLPVIA